MDQFLSCETSISERIAHKECPRISCHVVCSSLDQERRAIEDSNLRNKKENERKRLICEQRIDIFNAADPIFHVFFSSTMEGPIVSKYRGALHQLLEVSISDKDIRYPC